VFLTPNPDNVPHAMLHSLKHYKALHERVVLVSVDHPRHSPRTDAAGWPWCAWPGDFWQVRVFYGFMEQPNLPERWNGVRRLRSHL
jgi:KUP system potassium uptake protein